MTRFTWVRRVPLEEPVFLETARRQDALPPERSVDATGELACRSCRRDQSPRELAKKVLREVARIIPDRICSSKRARIEYSVRVEDSARVEDLDAVVSWDAVVRCNG